MVGRDYVYIKSQNDETRSETVAWNVIDNFAVHFNVSDIKVSNITLLKVLKGYAS